MNWWKKLRGQGPEAKVVKPAGNHIENLQTHPVVSIQQIGETAELPVWVDVPPEEPTTSTFNGLLWEVEPMGEYLYFLAGNFPKNERGLLRYASAKTIAEVYVSFEDDVISVDRSEMQRSSEIAHNEMTYSSDFIGMQAGEISAFAHDRTQSAGYARRLATLSVKDLRGGIGYMEQADEFNPGPWVRLLWSKNTETSQGLRVTKIAVRSSDADQQFGPMHDLLTTLIDRYQNIEDHPLSGAVRM
ncbi:hypothetical protein [Leisingera sp. ANG-M7]|uniref:hypothetical protein n=1 Tax=Leisingera sp. ANG-M7 TaxID=1577902 RepID=UPI00126A46E1|nr:hypothetical protein [Leisingera sp. ANG-M7]